MLDATDPTTPWVIGIALLALTALLVWRAIRKNKHEYQRFKKLRSTTKRQSMLRRWLLQSIAVFGGSSAILLALSAAFVPLLLAEVNSWEFVAGVRRAFEAGPLLPVILTTVVVSLVAVTAIGIFAARKETDIPSIGDVQALLPRNRAELRLTAALAINAGVVEELMFRLAVPSAIFAVTGNAFVALVASVALFAALHIYQGAVGVVGSAIAGALFLVIFIASENILVAIVVHALFDLRSLVVIPMVIFRVHEKTSSTA